MKITKVLLSAALLSSALAFTSCSGSPDAGSGSGNNGPFLLSNNGETVEINYTNNTDEVQKFIIFAGENLDYSTERTGSFTIYDTGNCKYDFGFFFGYYAYNNKEDLNNNIAQFSYNGNDTFNLYSGYNNSDIVPEEFEKLNFDLNTLSNEKIDKYIYNLDFYEDGKIDCITVKFKKRDDSYVEFTGGSFPRRYASNEAASHTRQFGYYLSVQPGATSHLKFEIK